MTDQLFQKLVGEWITDPSDSESIKKYGKVSMLFKDNGQLIYRIHVRGETNIMLLTYQIQGGFLITNQASAPKEEKTAFSISPEGKLILAYGDHNSYFVKNTLLA